MKAGEIAQWLEKRRAHSVDVMLIHMDSFYNTQYSYFNMGLLYMATLLQKEGYRVKCMGVQDLLYLTREQIARIFITSKPSIVGFYTVSDNIYQVQTFAGWIKKWSPRTNIVVGGPLATSLGKRILQCPHFDMCVVGEGEIPIKALADFIIHKKGDIREIPGLIYEYRGELVSNPPPDPIADLDALPYPNHDLVGVQYSFHIVSGRGCPYNCIFCFQGVHGLKYRYRDSKKVVDEIITNMEKYGAVTFDIIDDTFISNPKRVREIASGIREYREKSGRKFLFFCQGRVDIMDKHPEMLEELKAAGLCRVQVGIESGHPRILELYRKKITTDQVKRVVKQANDLKGIVVVGNFILGGPFENEETFRASVELAKELVNIAPGAFEIGTAFMGPYPGTEIAEFPEKFGLKIYDNTFKKGLTLSDCHLTSTAFGVNEIRQLSQRFSMELSDFMKKQIPRIPRDTLKAHFDWAMNYKLLSQWYLSFLKEREALSEYFAYFRSPRFKTLDQIPKNELLSYFAQRTLEPRKYSKDGKQIILPETIKKIRLRKPEEILVYELSSGKLTIGQMLDEFRKEMAIRKELGKQASSVQSNDELLNQVFIPIFKKLEESYHLVFY